MFKQIKKSTIFIVLIIHLFFLFFFQDRSKKVLPVPIIVKTTVLQRDFSETTSPSNISVTKSSSNSKKGISFKTEKVKEKKNFSKEKIKKTNQIGNFKPQTKKENKIKSEKDKIDKKLMDQIDKSIKKLSNPMSQLVDLPVSLSLKIDKPQEAVSFNELSFREKLIFDFRRSLTLPEFGSVKIEIFLLESKIVKVKILESKSKKNEEYLKKTLPLLAFPWFNQYFNDRNERNFVITFTNEI